MIIDFHTHIFPDAMAEKTISMLENRAQSKANTNGCASGLLDSMAAAAIDMSVILPVVTAPRQFDGINRFAALINETHYDRLLSFGGIHPETDNYKEQLNTLKNMGFTGIKLHPDYQGVFFNDIRYKRIISRASELDMAIVVHAGIDIGLPEPVHCTPKMSIEVIHETTPSKLILAHMGGWGLWNEVEELLVGEHVYFDTAFIFHAIKSEQFNRIVNNHGSDKILFASDSPWGNQAQSVNRLKESGLSETVLDDIFYKNASKILNLSPHS